MCIFRLLLGKKKKLCNLYLKEGSLWVLVGILYTYINGEGMKLLYVLKMCILCDCHAIHQANGRNSFH